MINRLAYIGRGTFKKRMQKATERIVTITDRAANKVREYEAKADEQYLGLRLSIESSSCSCCTSYGLMLENSVSESDLVLEDKGVKIIINKSDLRHLSGAEIDYVQTLQRSGFRINNANRASSCGCG